MQATATGVTLERHATREAWLKRRLDGIGASEAAALIGASPWSNRLQVWGRKVGVIGPVEQTKRMEMGHRLEPIVAQMFADETGLEVLDHGDFAMAWRAGTKLFATIDREVRHPEWGPGVLEIKTTGGERFADWPPAELSGLDAEAGVHEIPEHVWWQIQAQARVTGATWAVVAILVGTDDFRYFKVGIDLDAGDKLEAAVAEFWPFVVNNEEPPADEGDDAKTVAAIHPRSASEDEAQTVTLPGEAVEWDQDLEEAKAQLDKWEAKKNAAQAKITQAIGDAKYGILPGARYSWPTINIKERICTQEMVGSVLRKASSHRRLHRKAL